MATPSTPSTDTTRPAGERSAAPERAGLSPLGAVSGASRAVMTAAFLIRLVGKNMER